MVLANGITFGSSQDDILATYGGPTRYADSGAWVYETDTIKLVLNFEPAGYVKEIYYTLISDDYWSEYAKENPLQ